VLWQLEESVRVVTARSWLPTLYALLERTVANKQKTMLFLQVS
jgi:hypothetical protein